MAYILAQQRNVDVSAAFRDYREYLRENEARFPPSAYALATSDWYFNFGDHRCPHDSWLEGANFSEPSSGERKEVRSCELTVRLLGAYHDGYIEIEYPEMYSYRFEMPYTSQGHGDWRYDEFRVNEKGHLIHEIEWAMFGHYGSWIIEASDVRHCWLPCTDA
jgi:hypothetical protein